MKTSLPFVLASGSPRRKEILDMMGISYIVDASDVDESFSGRPAETVIELSSRKANAVGLRHSDSLILAADTLVYTNAILGKPHTPERAKEMLTSLSGSWHNVYTGMVLLNTQTGRMIRNMERTRVHFVDLTEEDIDAYVATGEPLDKAGAYAIQGIGGMFIDRIDGSYSNVVGLSMSQLRAMLREMDGTENRYVGVI